MDDLLPRPDTHSLRSALAARSFGKAGGLAGDKTARVPDDVIDVVSSNEVPRPLPFVMVESRSDLGATRQVKAVLVVLEKEEAVQGLDLICSWLLLLQPGSCFRPRTPEELARIGGRLVLRIKARQSWITEDCPHQNVGPVLIFLRPREVLS
jgi:hypothetical protein